MNISELGGRPPRWSGAEANDVLLIREKKGFWGNLRAAFQSNLLFNVWLITNMKQLGMWI